MLNRWRRNTKGSLYIYLVIFAVLLVGVGLAFMFQQTMDVLQENVNPMLSEDHWLTSNHYSQFLFATTFVTNIWTYIIAFIIFVLLYWVYIYAQRRSSGFE